MYFFDISKLEVETVHVERTFAAEDIPFDYHDCQLVGDWRFEADITKNSRDEVAIHARIRGVVQGECDRCLKSFDLPLDRMFDIYLVPANRRADERERELKLEELDENFYTDPKISIVDIMKEQIILTLPMKLLCTSDCQGLCPQCGADLNSGSCDCLKQEQDPRWALLREMQNRMKK